MKLIHISIILLFGFGTLILADSTEVEWHDSNSSVHKSWSQAKNYCEDLVLDKKSDWRLPSISELESAYNVKNKFPNIETGYYWSSTEHESYPEHAWNLLFYNGDINYYNKSTENYILCVKDKEQISENVPEIKTVSQKKENNTSSSYVYIKSY